MKVLVGGGALATFLVNIIFTFACPVPAAGILSLLMPMAEKRFSHPVFLSREKAGRFGGCGSRLTCPYLALLA